MDIQAIEKDVVSRTSVTQDVLSTLREYDEEMKILDKVLGQGVMTDESYSEVMEHVKRINVAGNLLMEVDKKLVEAVVCQGCRNMAPNIFTLSPCNHSYCAPCLKLTDKHVARIMEEEEEEEEGSGVVHFNAPPIRCVKCNASVPLDVCLDPNIDSLLHSRSAIYESMEEAVTLKKHLDLYVAECDKIKLSSYSEGERTYIENYLLKGDKL
jgi:hypothetical protein